MQSRFGKIVLAGGVFLVGGVAAWLSRRDLPVAPEEGIPIVTTEDDLVLRQEDQPEVTGSLTSQSYLVGKIHALIPASPSSSAEESSSRSGEAGGSREFPMLPYRPPWQSTDAAAGQDASGGSTIPMGATSSDATSGNTNTIGVNASGAGASASAGIQTTRPVEPPEVITHKITDGDTLQLLAQRYLGDPQRYLEILEQNRGVLTHPDILPIGARLQMPPRNPTQRGASPQGVTNQAGGPASDGEDLIPVPRRGQ
jgi:phage tail protein X